VPGGTSNEVSGVVHGPSVQARVTSDHGTLAAGGPADSAVGQHAADGEITVQALRMAFPEWRIFQQYGGWWALRGGPVRLDGPESLLLRAVTARGLTAMTEKLCVQDHLDRLDPQELAAVYRDMALPALPLSPCHEPGLGGERRP
jgi:hypothetical protein